MGGGWGGVVVWFFFFFNDTATTEIYTLSLHDALPICYSLILFAAIRPPSGVIKAVSRLQKGVPGARWSGPEKLHITVGYFGEVAEPLEIGRAHV